jgi:uncharacterized protein
MENLPLNTTHFVENRRPWRNIMLLLGFMLVGMSLGNMLGMILVMLLSQSATPLGLDDFSRLLSNPEEFPNAWTYIIIIQAVVHVFTFLLPSLLYWQWAEQHQIKQFLRKPWPPIPVLLLALLAVLVFMPFNSWIIELNSHLTLPAGLERVERWIRLKEDQLEVLTHFLTQFTSFNRLLVALLVIAVIPSVGEEVLFRGIIQRKIFNKTGDMHAAIWLSAMLFSAIHLQFYGFVPRMLLGAMFGYLYAWSQNLWIPILAHFINNGFTILVFYLHNRGEIELDITSSASSVTWWGAALSLGFTVLILLNLKKIAQRASFKNNDA